MLISRNKPRFGPLLRQVTIFFTVMLVMQILNLVLDLVFYLGVKSASDLENDE